MQKDDVQLIRSILSGDDAAFSTLVEKYKKGVHALIWRKIGDFHYAEEITQDTFLQVYKKLSTLKNPNQFAGWLYVIANRCCLNWMRKKKPAMQSLESISEEETDRFFYDHYVSEQREAEATEHRSEIVRKLLKRLPESERTVVTLYYLGDMTAKEIGKFLGVSVKTVHSRLHRARKRLQAKEELLVHEVLGGIQLPTTLTENIMRQVADIEPTPPPVTKPLLPWAAFGAATVLMVLLLGASHQYLTRFQEPYSFEAQSEPTIEIVDALVTVDIDAKPTVRNQAGRAVTPGRSSSTGLQNTDTTLTANTQDDSANFAASQWTRTNGPYGGSVHNIFATADRTLYAAAQSGIYRLPAGETTWTRINTDIPTGGFRMPMAAHNDILYIVSSDKIFASTDQGETWHVRCARPEGHAVGFIIMDEVHTRPVFYLALQDIGVFRSTDAGTQWDLLNDGFVDKSVYTVAAIGSTLFAGTSSGVYRLDSDIWQQLPTSPPEPIYWLTGFENSLYAGTGPDLSYWGWIELNRKFTADRTVDSRTKFTASMAVDSRTRKSGSVFHSTDLGASWTEITDRKESYLMQPAIGITVLSNTGKVQLPQGPIAIDKDTFYRASSTGIHRTTDARKSWHTFMNGIRETRVQNLLAVNNRLYTHTNRHLLQSVDGGETWETVPMDSDTQIVETMDSDTQIVEMEVIKNRLSYLHFASQLTTVNDVVYGIVPAYKIATEKVPVITETYLRLFQRTVADDAFVPIQGAPTFKGESSAVELSTADHLPNNPEKHEEHDNALSTTHLIANGIVSYLITKGAGAFSGSGQTFYLEWNRRLFKWKHGDAEWTDTGLIDNGEPLNRFDSGFKLAVSGDTVYVGKRDGKLFQSLDGGSSWKNITPTLPIHFTHFKEIIFAGSTVYVATNQGVLCSQTGAHWRVLTDSMGQRITIDRFAVKHTSVYGANDTAIYSLDDRGQWKQISRNVPDKIIAITASSDRLYIATQNSGLFHIALQKNANALIGGW